LLWTSRKAESKGIHVHAFKDRSVPEVDETFSAVRIDRIELDPQMVRVLMAQMTLPFLKGRVVLIECPQCSEAVFEDGDRAFTPEMVHTCKECGTAFGAKGRYRKVIGNPLIGVLSRLASCAPRAPQKHELLELF
jgi:hypothetical protein